MKKTGSFLLMAALLCNGAMAPLASADTSTKTQDPAWLVPGFKIVLSPVIGSGSITMVVTDNKALMFCAAEVDGTSANQGTTPNPGTTCNTIITKPGYAFPPEAFIKGQSGWKTDFKIFFKALAGITLITAPSVAASGLIGGAPLAGVIGAEATGSVINPGDQIQSISDQALMANTISKSLKYSNMSAKAKDCQFPVVTVANSYDDMKVLLLAKIKSVAKKLVKGNDPASIAFGKDYHDRVNAVAESMVSDPKNAPANEEADLQQMLAHFEAERIPNLEKSGACDPHKAPITPPVTGSTPASSTDQGPAAGQGSGTDQGTGAGQAPAAPPASSGN